MTFSDFFLAFIPEIFKGMIKLIPYSIEKYRIKKFFGPSVLGNGNFWLVVDPYYHPAPRTGANRYIKRFLGRRQDHGLIGEDRVLGSNILRLLGYIATSIGKYRDIKIPLTFTPDEEVVNRWDGTFICFGSSDSNIITFDIENLPQNNFYTFETDQTTGFRFFRVMRRDYMFVRNEDRAIIFRIRNPRSPQHYLFICAGLGEWGTSGSTRYLFYNWKSLYKRFKDKNFIIVLGVRPNSDESAEEIFNSTF